VYTATATSRISFDQSAGKICLSLKQPIVGWDVSRAELKSAKIGSADILETRLSIMTKICLPA